jgi:hypothetical protein
MASWMSHLLKEHCTVELDSYTFFPQNQTLYFLCVIQKVLTYLLLGCTDIFLFFTL